MGRRLLNLTPEEKEMRRVKRIAQSRAWAAAHPDEIRATAREYHQRHKERINLRRIELRKMVKAADEANNAAYAASPLI